MMFVAPRQETDKYRDQRYALQGHRTPEKEVHSADDFLVPVDTHDNHLLCRRVALSRLNLERLWRQSIVRQRISAINLHSIGNRIRALEMSLRHALDTTNASESRCQTLHLASMGS
jgi:hypothetical protein